MVTGKAFYWGESAENNGAGGWAEATAIATNHEHGEEEHVVWGTRGWWCSGLLPLMMCWAEGSDPALELVTVTKVVYLCKLVIFHPFYYMQTSASTCIPPPLSPLHPCLGCSFYLPSPTKCLSNPGRSVEVPLHLLVFPDLQY